MPRPKEGYRLADGTKVPGSTDITRRFMDTQALIAWARNQGFAQAKEGLPKPNHYERSALDVGTIAMGMIEFYLRGRTAEQIEVYARSSLGDPLLYAKANASFDAFKTWAIKVRLRVHALEVSLVSEKYRFGCTLDIVGYVNDKLAILEVKTSPKPYPDHVIQMAAQRQAWEEDRERPRITGGHFLLCCPKDGSPCVPHYYPQLRDAFRQFVVLRKAYDIDRVLADPDYLAGEAIVIEPPPTPPQPKPVRVPKAVLRPRYAISYTNFQPAAGSHPAAGALPGGPSTSTDPAGPGAARAIPLTPEAKPVAAPDQRQKLPPAVGAAQRSTAPNGSGGDPGRREDSPGDTSIPEFLRRAKATNTDGWASFNEASK
jgi:hypothetical protein